MDGTKKGDDAADHAPKPDAGEAKQGSATGRQDAPNDDGLKDGGKAVPLDELNSANDE